VKALPAQIQVAGLLSENEEDGGCVLGWALAAMAPKKNTTHVLAKDFIVTRRYVAAAAHTVTTQCVTNTRQTSSHVGDSKGTTCKFKRGQIVNLGMGPVPDRAKGCEAAS
jgi:hypothetical protein